MGSGTHARAAACLSNVLSADFRVENLRRPPASRPRRLRPTRPILFTIVQACRQRGINPFDYLMAIARNGDAIAAAPENWLPWNYPKTAPTTADTR